MKYNYFFKLFTLVFIFILFSVPSFAQAKGFNVLKEVVIEKADTNSYNINLLFKEKYKDNAFIQKRQAGEYYVYIPNVVTKARDTKITYKNKNDKSSILVNVQEKPFIRENEESTYVKLSVNLADDYSIRLLSKTMSDKKDLGLTHPIFNSTNFFSLLILIIAAFAIKNITKILSNRREIQSYTSFPASYLNSPDKYIAEQTENIITPKAERTLPKVNIKRPLKKLDDNSFSCFELPFAEEEHTNIEIRQKNTILRDRTATQRHTNPITKSYMDISSECTMPMVEDLKPKKQISEENAKPELISELHITPTKGFYLTTDNDKFALFGFVKDKVFLLKKFTDLAQINLQARYYDNSGSNDLYIVRLDSYKAMIEISESGMKELAVL